MCSGLGACRKTLDGTMCPSYMATREEADSTRGRANVLRLAMAGRLAGSQVPTVARSARFGEAGALTDDDVRLVLDLCLECRACKAECPVGVDVARFKSEFLARYWQRNGTSMRARVLGHVAELAALASPIAPLANAVARSAPARWMNERLVGIDRRRVPPAWTRDTFEKQFTLRSRRATADAATAVRLARPAPPAVPHARPTACTCSATPSRTTTTRRSASRASKCWKRPDAPWRSRRMSAAAVR